MAADATTTLTANVAVPEKITNAQTVCNRKNEKGKLCNGHIKQLHTGGEEAEKHLRGDDVLFKCQSCGTLYMGPPLGHVRDVDKQQRFVEKELAALLRAAGGSLPAIKKNDKGVYVLAEVATQHAPAAAAKPAAGAAKPAAQKPAAPAAGAHMKSPSETKFGPIPGASGPVPGETPEQKLARLKAVAAEAKRRKALLEAEEGTEDAAAPAAGTATTPTPAATTAAAETKSLAPSAAALGPIPGASGPVPGETPEQKMARLKAVVAEAKRRKALLEGEEGAGGAAQPAVAHTTPAAASTSGTDSSPQADAHRPAAEAQAATGMASAAPLSAAAATASPVAGAETPEDLAPDTVSSSTAQPASKERAPIQGASGPVPGETPEEKIARLKAVVAEAKRRKALESGE